MVLNEKLRLEVDYDGSGWADMGLELANLSEVLETIGRLREDGSTDRCLAGYRVLCAGGLVVLVLAPVNLRITGARFRSSGVEPETSTV